MPNQPIFSILHTSVRPNEWEKVYRSWLDNARYPLIVEYVLVVDHDWGFDELPIKSATRFIGPLRPQDKVMWQSGPRHNYVTGVNKAAAASTGKILIVNADDQYPCRDWDFELLHAIRRGRGAEEKDLLNEDFVILPSTGTKDEHIRRIAVMPILSRTRYEKYGHVFYPQYESMFADNDFLAHARHDKVVIEAKHLLFPHKHPYNDNIPMDQWDDAYKAQNKESLYQLGYGIFDSRCNHKFADLATVSATAVTPPKPTLAICLPGESFSKEWVAQWTEILCQLGAIFNILPVFNYTSNVYTTRAVHAKAVKEVKADYIVWIDDDNIVTPGQIYHLIEDLQSTNADVVAGWCWIIFDEDHVRGSCGWFDGIKGRTHEYSHLETSSTDLVPVEWTGFPVVAMKGDIFSRMPPHPFIPLLSDEYPYGHSGEDVAFGYQCQQAKMTILVDRTVKVPHLKRKPDEPVTIPTIGKAATSV